MAAAWNGNTMGMIDELGRVLASQSGLDRSLEILRSLRQAAWNGKLRNHEKFRIKHLLRRAKVLSLNGPDPWGHVVLLEVMEGDFDRTI
jgi:hypothetical protein